MDRNKILYPKDLPKHHAVGRVFYAWDGQVYYCDSYDPRCDYWMTNVIDAADRKAVSPRAIGGTFLSAWDSYKPAGPEEVVGREFHMVDLRVPHEQFSAVRIDEKDCLELDERQILFFDEWDAVKFLKNVRAAAVKRAATQALPPAPLTVPA
jgi:hypothetical protein